MVMQMHITLVNAGGGGVSADFCGVFVTRSDSANFHTTKMAKVIFPSPFFWQFFTLREREGKKGEKGGGRGEERLLSKVFHPPLWLRGRRRGEEKKEEEEGKGCERCVAFARF